jgi:hypothetical protein
MTGSVPILDSQRALAIPPAARAVLTSHGIDADSLRRLGKLGLRRPVTRLGGCGIVLEITESDAGRLRIQRELWGRDWAVRHGVPTATVHAADPDGEWMIGEWITPGAPSGPSFLDAALATANRIAAAPPPTAGPPPNVWRSARRDVVLRTARALAGRMPMRLWWASRTAARTLPLVPVAHGDYYHRNVLWRPDAGSVCVVDWEYLGAGPRHGDLLRLWTILPARADREDLMTRILAAAPPAQHREIATLALWLALRLLGENIKAARPDRNAADVAHARSIQPEARALAHAHDAWPL